MIKASLPNVIAMIFSIIAMIQLFIAASKIGGSVGMVIRLMVAGIFFSVFTHAGFELTAQIAGVSRESLMVVMGILITLGSCFFIAAGTIAFRKFR